MRPGEAELREKIKRKGAAICVSSTIDSRIDYELPTFSVEGKILPV
jgi:hypothetical protein